MKKQNRRDPIKVMLILTVCLAVLAAGCMLLGNAISAYRANALSQLQAEVEAINEQRDQEYARALAEFEAESQSGANLAWPPQKTQGWDVVDLTNYPLENPGQVTLNRADVMNNGMLLVNEWHSRPEDFSEEALVSIGSYTGGKLQVANYNLLLFPEAINALQEAVTAAAAEGFENYMVDEAYRSYEEQNALFNKYMEQYASRYSGDALIARTKKDVNYPGTSEFNSGMTFTLRLYKRGDAAVNSTNYVDTPEGQWLSENCWKYGLVFRFPKTDYPVKGTADKSYKTGVSVSLRAYRYVGKGNAAVMHTLDLCLEEYIEYLQEHPHIAVFEDGILRYEIVRQYVGDAASFPISITNNASSYVTSLDNMGYAITVFER
ncbi:MAG: M15 family metallopeptidase [Eubacteriales bacterium]|nr:M15 family metallopeptidase [Eubacteriales bacterium]